MEIFFYIAGILAILSTLMVVVAKNAVHALLYFIVSLLSVSVIFFILGAPFIAALEVIIYAGAIMVLFVFVIMMLHIDSSDDDKAYDFMKPKVWIGPSIIALILVVEMLYMLFSDSYHPMANHTISPEVVGKLMFTKYALVVDLAGFLLTAGIVGAYHLGQKERKNLHRYLKEEHDKIETS
ncbi:MAG: NADH-quinone oxidoreductase subunit J [Gelidibacter sp.]|uniref:NADH-quinone oxidoreductase subunit J n=1 Tax=Gelidibacter sp. TaxID=2018083 RepID=UPI00326738DC